MRLALALVPTIAALLSPLARADVFVVDWRGGPNVFKTIQAAVDAAKTDDTVLILDGGYDELVTISGKALTILGGGPEPASVVINRSPFGWPGQRGLRLVNHPAGRTSRIARLQLGDQLLSYGSVDPALEVSGAGSVILDEVVSYDAWSIGPLQGALLATRCIVDDYTPVPIHALALTNVDDAILAGCGIRGGAGMNSWESYNGVATLGAVKSNLEIMGSPIVGMKSPRYHFGPGNPGNGIDLTDSTLLLTASMVTGGNGDVVYGLLGADGIGLVRSSLAHSDSTILGGTGKTNGMPIRSDASSRVRAVNQPVALGRDIAFKVGKTTTISIRGLAGQPTLTLFGGSYARIPLGFGTLRIDPGTLIVPLVAVLDGQGAAKLPFSLANVHPIYIGSTLHVQTLALDAVGRPSLSTPLASIVLW